MAVGVKSGLILVKMGEPADRQPARERELEEQFLGFLNSDRPELGLSAAEVVNERARRYVEIHARLVRLFGWRGCGEPEMLADRTLDRAKQTWIKRETGQASITDPVAYVCSFVRFIFLEWLAEQRRQPSSIPTRTSDVDEVALECLDQCMQCSLVPEERNLISEYYQGERRAKIDHRRAVAERHHLSVNALRIECYRIRRRLRACVMSCISRRASAAPPSSDMK